MDAETSTTKLFKAKVGRSETLREQQERERFESVRGQEIVTTLDRPEGGDIIKDYGRKTGELFREVIPQFS